MVINDIKINKILLLLLFSISSVFAQTADTDGDGIVDVNDRCPNTPIGTVVNAYGCPTTIANCDYTSSSFSTNIVGTVPATTTYLLVNSANGMIDQISTSPTFSGLTGTKTYMVLAYSYTGTATGLTVGAMLSGVSASCQDWSNALMVKVCVATALPSLNIPATLSKNENAGTATITVTLSSASTSPVTVNYATSNGSASAGNDFITLNGTITFAPGETTKTITVPLIDDTTPENSENFLVTLTNPTGATINGTGQTNISIIDNDVVVNNDLDADGVTNDKDLCPNTPAGTTVNAYGCPTSVASCDYTTSSFSAAIVGNVPAETRYLLVNSLTGTIVQINTNPTFTGLSGTNTFMVLAYSYTGATTGLAVGNQLSSLSSNCQDFSNALLVKVCVSTIPPVITVSIPPTITVNENAGTATITVTLSSASTAPVTVNYGTANGSAIVGTDFTNTTGTITFNAGETTKTITIPILDDTTPESLENFLLTLSNPSGATISAGQTIVSIVDNDIANTDSDGDGVPDNKDLCPNTSTGTTVNTFGCPINIANCDYNTSSVTFASTTPPVGKITKYVLADVIDGKITQVSNTPTFTGLAGTKTYMVLAYSYENDGTVVNLTTNNFINQVSTACGDWSNALVVKICAPFIDNNICDYSTSTITLATTTVPASGTTQYVLVNQSGTIVQVSNTSTFTGLSGTNTYNAYAISYTGSVNGLSLGNNFSNVSGSCFDWSSPISIKVCVCKPNICLPITIVKRK
jgi:hypothetical protein